MVGLLLTFVAARSRSWPAAMGRRVLISRARATSSTERSRDRRTRAIRRRLLDSTLDRYSEGAIYWASPPTSSARVGRSRNGWYSRPLPLSLGSFLVSYVRARAQSLGFTCDSGIFARPERVVVTVIGLIFGGGRALCGGLPARGAHQPDGAAAHPRGVAAGARAAPGDRARDEGPASSAISTP